MVSKHQIEGKIQATAREEQEMKKIYLFSKRNVHLVELTQPLQTKSDH